MADITKYLSIGKTQSISLPSSPLFTITIEKGRHSYIVTLSLLIVTFCSGNIFHLPSALEETGWIGVGFLLFAAIGAYYTSNRLNYVLESFGYFSSCAELGEFAFEHERGRYFAILSFYLPLLSMSLLNLIVCGKVFHALVGGVIPLGYCALLVGLIAIPFSLGLKSMHDTKWIIFPTLAVMIVLFITLIAASVVFTSSHNTSFSPNTKTVNTDMTEVLNGFAHILISVCPHALMPYIYMHMEDKSRWDRIITFAWMVVISLYIVIMIVGYYSYGTALSYNGRTYVFLISPPWLQKIGQGFMLIQLLVTVQIYLVPVYETISESRYFSPRYNVLARGILYLFLLVFASIFSDLFNFITMLGAVPVVWIVFVVPAVLYWKISPIQFHEKMCLSVSVMCGVLSMAIVVYLSTNFALDDCDHFSDLFTTNNNTIHCE